MYNLCSFEVEDPAEPSPADIASLLERCGNGLTSWFDFTDDFGKPRRHKMGGFGSGRRGGRATTCDYLQLDVRLWQRSGLLVRFGCFSCGYWNVAVSFSKPEPNWVFLSRLDYSPEKYQVWLEWTPCNYGGARPWFLCPMDGCRRRVAILYAGATIACRQCRNLAYSSQQESRRNRTLRRAQAIRRKLGASANLTEPFPPRPRGMHRRTYRRLFSQSVRREAAFFGDCLGALHKLDRLASKP